MSELVAHRGLTTGTDQHLGPCLSVLHLLHQLVKTLLQKIEGVVVREGRTSTSLGVVGRELRLTADGLVPVVQAMTAKVFTKIANISGVARLQAVEVRWQGPVRAR